MSRNITAFWHKESFDRFLRDGLPQLLAARLPLAGYQYRSNDLNRYNCHIKVVLASTAGDVEIEYDVPQPDEEGIFEVEGERRVVVPTASQEELDVSEIKCVGEQLYDYIEKRLSEAPPAMPWDESLARAWLPLDTWIRKFLRDEPTAQTLQEHNWLDKHTHLRRITLLKRDKVYTSGHFGRVCPFETPEGPNVGRILSIAVGAEIRDGKLVIVDENAEAQAKALRAQRSNLSKPATPAVLGLTATMAPFLEHNDPNRQLMGVNMMRQWFVPPDPEPALVQTGNEPDAPGFWCGRNVLTAYVSWGVDTFEDGIVMSESCANRFNYPYPVEPGDKFSNRHGTKGVVARILPDEEMPRLTDGTPVELVFSVFGLQTRMNFGQIREAVMGRIAKATGEPTIVPPFHTPSEHELRERLKKAGLPEDGMEILTPGRNGVNLNRPSTVGWVYWGRLYHIAREKIRAPVGRTRCMRQGEFEYYVLRDIAAYENLMEQFNTRAAERDDADTLAKRVAKGPVEQAGPPTPMFENLRRHLAAAGIRAELEGEKLTFRFARPEGETLKLARPTPHPWLHGQKLDEVGVFVETGRLDEGYYVEETSRRLAFTAKYRALAEVNARAERMFASDAPESLTRKALEQLETRVREYFDALLGSEHLRFGATVLFSGRAVIVPGGNLRIDQVGVPEEIAWTLFSPLVTRELGDEEEVLTKSQRATQTLDEIMARSWVLVNHAPTTAPTSILAFHPVRCPEKAIHLHPLVCRMLNADFDGDQVAIFLPITEGAQREAGERLSVAGHLARDPKLLAELLPTLEAMWGIASLSLTPEGRKEISALVGIDVAAPDGFITKNSLADAMRVVLERDGIERTLVTLEKLMQRGFEVAKESGASMNPFIGASIKRPPSPAIDDNEAWNAYAEEIAERIASRRDFADNDLGVHILAAKSGVRGGRPVLTLTRIIGPWNLVSEGGETITIRHGYRDGLTPDELPPNIRNAWEGLAQTVLQVEQFGQSLSSVCKPKGFNVLARAMRAKRPGIIFANAAATGEIDPLTDVDSRLFVGLSVAGER